MEIYKIENLSFAYPNRTEKALSGINISIGEGEFLTLCGKSGCGKTTLLRLLKTSLAPFGNFCGSILFKGKSLSVTDVKEQAAEIGFVMQNPDNQIVTDKVWHELAFGLESLGYSTPEIRTRVAEMASFFGIQNWFHKKVTELSGGQKQLLNLASVMVMQPSVLILDEPTSQLDPIAAQEFLKTLEKINRELGTTVILSEHRLEEAFPISDRIIVMDDGKIIADDKPQKTGRILKEKNHDMYAALPAPMRVYGAVDDKAEWPVTVREGRVWLENFSENNTLFEELIPEYKPGKESDSPVIEAKDVWFRYDKDLPDVVKGLNIKVGKGEFFAVLGGNGTGKTTALSLISGLFTPYRGKILINGEKPQEIKNLYDGILGVLPQNPQALFVKNTVFLDLLEILSEKKISKAEKEERIKNIAAVCRISELLDSHPYDLSGGEQQRAALAKILLKNPRILLLDEPTKGMDAHFKQIFADILKDLKQGGVTVVMVSHDIEFCAENADRCAMFFDGNITSVGTPREFFAGKSFYTTSANRMARTRLEKAVLAEDIILACGGKIEKREHTKPHEITLPPAEEKKEPKREDKKLTPKRMALGGIFAALFVITCVLRLYYDVPAFQLIAVVQVVGAFVCLFPQKELGTENVWQPENKKVFDKNLNPLHPQSWGQKKLVYLSGNCKKCNFVKDKRKLTKRTLTSMLFVLPLIVLTIFTGVFYLENKKYYFISLLIILETLIPFCMIFENRKPQARELVVISVLCAVAVAGRSAFFMLPQFKPVAAVIIIAGVCFGGEAGFLVGAVTGFVSNFFFGQGPWTPWQMFAFGIIGFLAGIFFRKGFLAKTKASLCVFGAAVTFLVYGGIMNPASVIMWQDKPTWSMIASAYLMGISFDMVHAVSTAFFMWFISEPMIDKIDRIKVKYGLL